MNKVIHTFLVLLIFSNLVFADNQQALQGFIIFAAGTSSTGAMAQSSHLVQELKDWKDSESQTTTVFENQCGMLVEGTLIGNNRKNYLLLGINNKNDAEVVLKSDDIKFIFTDSTERYPRENRFDIEIKANWYLLGLVDLPFKEDFRGQKDVIARLPFENSKGKKFCEVSLRFERNQMVPEDLFTSTTYSAGMFGMAFGRSVLRTNELSNLGQMDLDLAIDMRGYGINNHGAYLSYLSQDLRSGQSAFLQNLIGPNYSTSGKSSLEHTSLGYSYIAIRNPKHSLDFDIGLSSSRFDYYTETYNKDWRFLSVQFAVNYNYMYSRVHSRKPDRNLDYFVGLSLVNNYIPPTVVNNVGIGGVSSSLMAYWRYGY
jgi:hypothetical protein